MLRGLGKSLASHHDEVGVGDGQDERGPVRRSGHASEGVLSVHSWHGARWDDGVGWQEGGQVGLDSDGSHSRSATSVRDGKGLVQVEVTHIGSNEAGAGEADLGIHVGPVHVDLSTVVMDDLADLVDLGLVHSVGGWVGDHERPEVLRVLLHLLLQVINVNVALLVGLAGDDLHSGHHRARWVGSVSRDRDDAHVPVVVSVVVVVRPDGHEASVLPRGSTVWLHGHGVKPGDLAQDVGEVSDHLRVPRGLVLRGEGVEVGELIPGDGHHFGRRVELHGAGSQRDHRVAQGQVLGLEPGEVPEHLVLRVVRVEHGVGQVVRSPAEITDVLGDALSKGLSSERARPASEDGEERVHVLEGGGLVKGDGDAVLVHLADVVVLSDSGGNDGSGLALPDVDGDGVEEHLRPGLEAELLGSGGHDAGEAVDPPGDMPQAVGSVVHSVHGGDVGEQGLGGADVRGSLLPPDVLLAGLHGHAQRGVSVLVDAGSDDPSGHDPLVLVRGGQEGGVGSAVSHGHAEPLGGSDGDVRPQLSRRGEHGQGEQIGGHDDLGVHSMGGIDDRAVLVQGSVSGGVLQEHSAHVVPAEVEVGLGGHDALQAEPVRPGGAHGDGLGVALVRDEELWLLAVGHGTAHGHGLGGGGGLVEQRGVREGEPGEVGDHGLVVEQGLEPALGDLRLVGGVLSVPPGVLEQVPQDHGGGQGTIVPHADEVLVELVLGAELLHVREVLALGEGLGELAQLEGPVLADVRRHRGVDQGADGLEAAVVGHLALDAGGGVADVPRDEAVTGLERVDRDPAGLTGSMLPRASERDGARGNLVLSGQRAGESRGEESGPRERALPGAEEAWQHGHLGTEETGC
mmetsp:Transcript_3300/g.11596  ORF Transcript_3300/g.11596 Transcript_3300/m.11596 type:complete len:853 (+) Transcript_3300:643-3201(+)